MAAISRPKNLTAKEWRANKGLFTKTVSDATGMGKALDRLDIAWNGVPWDKVDPDQATAHMHVGREFDSDYTVANVNKAKEVAHQHAAQVNAVKEQLQAVETLAQRTETAWKGNKLVPSSSIKYVDQVQTAAKTLREQLDKLDDTWKVRLQAADVSEKLIRQKLNSQIESRIVILRDSSQAMLDKPSPENFGPMYDSFRDLIPLLKKSNDRQHQALLERLEPLTGSLSGLLITKETLESGKTAGEVAKFTGQVKRALLG